MIRTSTENCIEWTGRLDRCGYGIMRFTYKGERRDMPIHRYVYALTKGWPGRGIVMHSCDNRACINPRHLSCGTQLDNIRDMDRKGRRNAARPGRQRNGR